MEKLIKPIVFSLLLLFCIAFAQTGLGQTAPLPPSNDQKGTGGNKGPTGAPLDGGVLISLAMAAGYGAYKWLKVAQKKNQTTND